MTMTVYGIFVQRLTKADRVWNRVCTYPEPPGLRRGDKALYAMLRAHGLICNGGVYHCVKDCLNAKELQAAMDGYRYFGLEQAAKVIKRAQRSAWTGRSEGAMDRAYDKIIHTDSVLVRIFEEHYAKHSEAYAPIS